jgi:hypothetical protein
MFRWYKKADVCYVYLADVYGVTQLSQSRWFTRGWTLQELVAPAIVLFYNSHWEYFGTKEELREELQEITDIDVDVLTSGELETVSIARRMSWAAMRRTTRVEDQAYCLLGIFDVNMPLLYGEGNKAFTRLQEEIMKTSDDQSLFAWGLPDDCKTMQQYTSTGSNWHTLDQLHGILADAPSDFTYSSRIHVLENLSATFPPMVTNNGIRIEMQTVEDRSVALHFGIINCTMQGWFRHYLGLPMVQLSRTWFARSGPLVLVAVTDVVLPDSSSPYPYLQPHAILIKAPTGPIKVPVTSNIMRLVNIANGYNHYYTLTDVRCSPSARYDIQHQEVTLHDMEKPLSLHAIFIYEPTVTDPAVIFPNVGSPRLGAQVAAKLYVKRKGTTTLVRADGAALQDRYTFFCRPFAVIVGGTVGDSWVKSMLILDNDNPDRDFQQLHASNEDLVRSCITREQLASFAKMGKVDESFSKPRRPNSCHPVLHWQWSSQPLGTVPGLRQPSETRRLHVHARVEQTWSNLVERSLAVFVELKEDATFTATEVPRWWSSVPTENENEQ